MSSFEFKKRYGQNFINDRNIIDKIVKYSNIDKTTLVIEIGPGSGMLSKSIIPLSGYTILYEIDNELEEILNDNLKDNLNYEIIFGDFLKQDLSKIRKKYKYDKVYVVANLPYYITTPIITKLFMELYPDRMIVMVQDEVADRLSAQNGTRDYGMISALFASRYKISKLFKVSRKCFIPQPNVDSAVISFDKNNDLENVDIEKYEVFLKDAFQFKRKKLRNNLKKYDLGKIEEILKQYNYSLDNRAEDIPYEVFIKITKYL